MKSFIKCDLCNKEISGERCELAAYKRVIDGKEQNFCCERHAEEFEKTKSKSRAV